MSMLSKTREQAPEFDPERPIRLAPLGLRPSSVEGLRVILLNLFRPQGAEFQESKDEKNYRIGQIG